MLHVWDNYFSLILCFVLSFLILNLISKKLEMEDNLKDFCNWKVTSTIFGNGRRPQIVLEMNDDLKYFWKWKTTSKIFANEGWPQIFNLEHDLKYFCKWKMTSSIFLLMEDNLELFKLKIKDVQWLRSHYFVGQSKLDKHATKYEC